MCSDDLKRAVAAAKQILKSLASKYEGGGLFKEAKPYLVFSSRLGQTHIDSTLETQLKEFPEMFEDDRQKETLLQDIKNKVLISPNAKVSYRDDVNIEIRFTTLVYELIWLLQQDPLIDRNLTPATHASIRIVVGAIGDLSKC